MRKILLIAYFLSSPALALPTTISGAVVGSTDTITVETQVTDKKALVVIFLSAVCPCSNSHIPVLQQLAKKHSNVRFLAIHSNVDEGQEITELYFKNAGLPFSVIQDQGTKLADEFKALKTPHAFVINRKGEFIYQGGVTNSSKADTATKHFLAEALDDIEQNKPIRTAEGRTLGCAIAREEEHK